MPFYCFYSDSGRQFSLVFTLRLRIINVGRQKVRKKIFHSYLHYKYCTFLFSYQTRVLISDEFYQLYNMFISQHII